MENAVYIKSYEAPEYDIKEIVRYMGAKEKTEQIEEIISECIEELGAKLSNKVCWCELPVRLYENCVDFSAFRVVSEGLVKNLKNCSSVILFAATIGIEIDRLISRYSSISPARALAFQAIGAERIESLCDTFNAEISLKQQKISKTTVPRFSPGYGDFQLDVQNDIFRVLEPFRRIGLGLNESLLMSPSKSVTGIIGISDCVTPIAKQTGCKNCDKSDCEYRR